MLKRVHGLHMPGLPAQSLSEGTLITTFPKNEVTHIPKEELVPETASSRLRFFAASSQN
jgi:hypothetical protein